MSFSRSIFKLSAAGDSADDVSILPLPLVKPPYARVTAIDMSSGDHLWMAVGGGRSTGGGGTVPALVALAL